MRPYYCFFFLILLPLAGQAESLNLEQAVSEALGDSFTVQKSQSVLDEKYWKKRETFSEFLPHVKGVGTYLSDIKYQYIDVQFAGSTTPSTIPSIVPSSQFNLSAELSIFNGFASTNRYQAASLEEQAAVAEFDWTRFNKEVEVTLAFYQVLAAKILKETAEQNSNVLKDHLRETQLLKKNGISTHYDVLKVDVELSNANSVLLDAQDNIEIAYEQLAQAMGHESEKRDIKGELPTPSSAQLQKIISAATAERKDITALRQKKEASTLEAKADSRFWVPKISLFGQYNLYNNINNKFDDYEAYRNARQFGIMLTWEIFDGFRDYSQFKQSVQQKIQLETTLRENQVAAKNDLARWQRKYRYFSQLYNAKNDDVAKSMESVRLAKAGHKVGARTNRDLLEAESDLYNSQAAKIHAQLGAVEALLKLKLAVGSTLISKN